MNKLLITAVVIFGFSSAAQAEPSKEAEKSQKVDPTLSKQEKKIAKASDYARKILDACETALSSVEEKGKTLTGVDKKMFDLFVAHAKLERDAAKDPEMAEHMKKHARHCKRYMGNANKYIKQSVETPVEKK